MAIDHNRPLPVPVERAKFIAQVFFLKELETLTHAELRECYSMALQAEQVEFLSDVRFFLQEAYDIYNARFR